MSQHSESMHKSLQDAYGELPYGMTNDYIFRAVLQSNNKVLPVMYLCRSFDQLNHGQDYGNAKPAVHIGLLDYTLFIEQPEFYASYKLINLKTHQTYSDGLTLNVLDLTRIDLATEEDKKYRIHEWARLFKATTWEEIKMLALKNEYLQEASETIFRMSADDLIRKRCLEREEHYQDMRNYERKIEEDKRYYERQIEQLRAEIEALKQQTQINT